MNNFLPRQVAQAAALCLIATLTLTPLHAASTQTAAGADINLSPKRVVFDAGGRAATVYIFNRGDAPATYSISLVDRVMTPDGRILAATEAVKDPATKGLAEAIKSPKAFIVYSPRRVTLQPNESQTIRIRAMRPGDLAPGEYRTHLTVTSVPPEDAGLTAEQAARPGEHQLSIKIVPVFSLSIPIIVRQGAADARAKLESTHLDGARKMVSVEAVRLGGSSVYGNFEVRAGKDVIGVVKGIAVYPEVEHRTVQIPLTRPAAKGETLSIAFLDDDASPGTELAKATLIAP